MARAALRITALGMCGTLVLLAAGCAGDKRQVAPPRDATPLERITERVTRLGPPGDPETPAYLLSLDEFFEGNDFVGSICANLVPTPHPQDVRAVLQSIASRDTVSDVRVNVDQMDDPEWWPNSDQVWVVSRATAEEVFSWFPSDVAPDMVWEGPIPPLKQHEPIEVPEGYRVWVCWWD